MKLALLLSLPFMLLFAAVSQMSFLVVDVKEGGPDGNHIVVPVPLILAHAASAFVPPQHARIDLPHEAEQYLPVAQKVIQALAEAPDGELVKVEAPDEQVSITKREGFLEVKVHGHNEDVDVRVPLAMATDLLRDAGGHSLRVSDAVGALRHLPKGKLVDVRDGHDHVQISVW